MREWPRGKWAESSERHAGVLIVGSGAGGATLAAALAPTGARIVILERGGYLRREQQNWDRHAVLIERRYHDPERWLDETGREYPCPTYYHVGGNTLFSDAVLSRFRREDFGSLQHAGGISPAWPVGYEEFAPYYAAAERLYQVRGTRGLDPSEPPGDDPYPHPAVQHEPAIAALACALRRQGMHPFPLPLGILRDESRPAQSRCIRCGTCGGHPCLVRGKADALTMAIEPALAYPNVRLVPHARVRRLETDSRGRSIQSVVVEQDGILDRWSADLVVLSAGAVNSAALLLASASARHPNGLANGSGLVGRHYMCQLTSSLIGITPTLNPSIFARTLGLNDFYLGSPDWPYPLGHVQTLHKAGAIHLAASYAVPPAGMSLEEAAARSLGLCMISEDLPNPKNRMTLDRLGRIVVRYHPNNREGHRRLVARMAEALGQLGGTHILTSRSVQVGTPLGQANANHQCGTVRFGHSSADSVLDRWCKAHELDNLYVVDAGFMPSSSATSPCLTVMANALRVAGHLVTRIRRPALALVAADHR